MKKTFLSVIIIALLSISCSKSGNDEDKQLELSYSNLQGKWYYKEFIKTDGSATPYKKVSCPANRDYVEFMISQKIVSSIFYDNCVANGSEGCSKFFFDNGTKKMFGCNNYFDGTVTNFTSSTLRIDYTDPQVELNGSTPIKAMVLTRN
jgi:hypothetical protein